MSVFGSIVRLLTGRPHDPQEGAGAPVAPEQRVAPHKHARPILALLARLDAVNGGIPIDELRLVGSGQSIAAAHHLRLIFYAQAVDTRIACITIRGSNILKGDNPLEEIDDILKGKKQ